jgi:hypothetical protein
MIKLHVLTHSSHLNKDLVLEVFALDKAFKLI